MKRDMKLVTKLLTSFEEAETPSVDRDKIHIEGYDQEVVNGHLSLLLDGGFLVDHMRLAFIPGHSRPSQIPGNLALSWKGHEYLDGHRQNSASQQAKDSA